jgi:hypothetical protein
MSIQQALIELTNLVVSVMQEIHSVVHSLF